MLQGTKKTTAMMGGLAKDEQQKIKREGGIKGENRGGDGERERVRGKGREGREREMEEENNNSRCTAK